MTAALELRKRLDERHEVVVLDPRDHFTFIPSLIWLPFGMRECRGRHVPPRPDVREQGNRIRQRGRRRAIDIDGRTVVDDLRRRDQLRQACSSPPVRGSPSRRSPDSGPDDGYTQSVCNLEHALLTGKALGAVPREPRARSSSARRRAARASAPRTSSCSTSSTGSKRPGSRTSRPSPSSRPSRSSAISASVASATPQSASKVLR